MRLIRIALCNANTTVGATTSNADCAIQWAREADKDGATLLALPEQTIGGYAQEDLVQWRSFVTSQLTGVQRVAEATRDLAIVIVLGVTIARRDNLYNCAALLHGGRIWGFVPKEKLPSYNVFYEGRTFARGTPCLHDEVDGIAFGDLLFDLDFGKVALEVCEDAWSPDGPMRRRCFAGAEVVVNISASPFRLGIAGTRREMLSTRSADNQCVVACSNLLGGNDGLIFDGGGYIAQNGRVLLDAARFREGLSSVTLDLDRTRRRRVENTTWRADQEAFVQPLPLVRVQPSGPSRRVLSFPVPLHRSFFLPEDPKPRSQRQDFCEELLDALALGLADYFDKTRAFKTIGVALSGGRDSLLCLWIAHRALAKRHANLDEAARKAKLHGMLRAFFMPSRYSSKETRAAAEKAAEELGVPLIDLSIDEAFDREEEAAKRMLQPGETLTALARQNIQARLRAERMWTWANSAGGLFLQTSNMSEKAVGYTTIGGDMEGALSVLANVPKTVVNYLLDYLFERTHSEAIRLTLLKPASAELAEDMEDEKDLMPFAVLDACFALFAGEKLSLDEVFTAVATMFPEYETPVVEAWVKKFGRLFTGSIYKWVQSPLSLHVGNLDLDRERALQLPVVQKTEW